MRQVAFWFLLPLVLAACFFVAAQVMLIDRWDEAYFSGVYLERYGSPRETVAQAAEAMNEGDQALFAETQAVRNLPEFPDRSELVYLFPHSFYIGYRRYMVFDNPSLWYQMQGDTVRFAEFLYADRAQHKLILLTAERVNGRWVFVVPGPYLYIQTGGWWRTWQAAALIYYIVFILRVTWVYMDRYNKATHPPVQTSAEVVYPSSLENAPDTPTRSPL